MSAKKNRGSNFSKEDDLMLLEEIYKQKDVVECKTTNKVSNVEKEKAWKIIADNFNAKSCHFRNGDQLKCKFDNLKTKARKIMVTKKNYIRGTGGGPAYDDNLDPILEAVLKIMNMKTVVGLQSMFDCDDSMMTKDPTVVPEKAATNPLFVIESCCEPINTFQIVDSYEVQPADLGGSAPCRQSPFTIPDDGEVPSTSSSDVPLHLPASKRTPSDDWSSYVPRKLKQPVSKKLKPSIPNLVIAAKERYYNVKALFLQEEIKASKARCEREEAEHNQKMKILQLEIKLKEGELGQTQC